MEPTRQSDKSGLKNRNALPAKMISLDGNSQDSLIFRALDISAKGYISKLTFRNALTTAGLRNDDPRINGISSALKRFKDTDRISGDAFSKIIGNNRSIVQKALQGRFIIPNFEEFCKKIEEIYVQIKPNNSGKVADYIPHRKGCRLYSPSIHRIKTYSMFYEI